ncbi:MAG: glycosyl hydrolase 53 family protein [Cellulosilyticum sp.]|nr:glycosyl hydrolase 53 family protein [Cellulosilyticum sp.]
MEFLKGMDISGLPELEDMGKHFYDKKGNEREIFDLLKENGVNAIRLRIWNNPENNEDKKTYCDLIHTVQMAKRIKLHQMHFLLDFHYSDYWADPGQQRKPKAWENLSFEELKQAVYQYTKEVIETLIDNGCMPDMVQVGNEIRSGMLFPEGEVPRYHELTQLINEGLRAVKDAGKGKIQTMIHLDQGGRYAYLKEWFDAVIAEGLDDFDYIGISYYPFWHGTFADVKDSMERLVERYQKPLMVVETAHPWRRVEGGFVDEEQEKIAGFVANIKEQKKVIDLVMNITASVSGKMAQGVYYWEPVVIPDEKSEGWSANMGIFDEKGVALPCLESFKFTREQTCFKEVAKVYNPREIIVEKGQKYDLPKEVEVLYFDGTLRKKAVEWKRQEILDEDYIEVLGIVETLNQKVVQGIRLIKEDAEGENLIQNANFTNGLDAWKVETSSLDVKYNINEKEHSFELNSLKNFSLKLSQEVTIKEKGNYRLGVKYCGTNTTGVVVKLVAKKTYSGILEQEELQIFPENIGFKTYYLDLYLEEGIAYCGIDIKSPPVDGKLTDMKLIKID